MALVQITKFIGMLATGARGESNVQQMSVCISPRLPQPSNPLRLDCSFLAKYCIGVSTLYALASTLQRPGMLHDQAVCISQP